MSDYPIVSKKDQESPADLNSSPNTIRGPEISEPGSGGDSKAPATSSPKGAEDSQMQLALRAHTYVTEFIKLADQKAGFLFALSTGLLAIMYKNAAQIHFLKAVNTWSFPDFLYFVALLALISSAALSFLVVKPRTKIEKPSGLIFWQTVASFDSTQDYLNKALSLSKKEVLQELFYYHYRLSKTCDSKYDNLNAAIIVGIIGITLSIILLIF